ncbi:rho GTPase-activating protein 20-like [Microcebus murinus]|uniref:rho GTPase-activating protein 20-like n=1 Tax=Microcebus murinus TaxID=30608 RepID=UPI003F6A76B4
MDACNEKMMSLQAADHTLLTEGPVKLKRGWRMHKRHLFLFTDVLLISNTKYKKTFKIKHEIPLSSLWTADYLDKKVKGHTGAGQSFILGWPTVNFVATVSSSELKKQWISLLQRYICLAKEKEEPKTIPLQILTADVKKYSHSVTVNVKNSDTVNDTINMSLAMLGLSGSEQEYQLSVSRGKKGAPQPLIGECHGQCKWE